MKGCRLQPKMHPFTMWCNKYKWLQIILKVQSVLLKWWRAINNLSTPQILIMNEDANQCESNTIFLQKCAAKNNMQLNFSSNSCFVMMENLSSNVNFFKKSPFKSMPQIIKCQICNILYVFSLSAPHMPFSSFHLWCSYSLIPLSLLFFF